MSTYITNKKIGLDYEILERFEAGIKLSGIEVKSVRQNQGNLLGAHITVRGGEAYLMNAFIPPYQEKNTPASYDPYRKRILLLKKSELKSLATQESQRGLTVVPISMYNKGRVIKVDIAIVRGKKKHDKRETLKKRQSDRDVAREFRDR
ncbi:MAG: SsrA-binding protein SmpB [Candidatus Taylorbacteria bacterium]|nr:SsrA-binding protein SmpB [Candidatus Taylorbacteria bacterium]